MQNRGFYRGEIDCCVRKVNNKKKLFQIASFVELPESPII